MPELTPKVALGPINWANRANKWIPPRKGGRKGGWAGFAHSGSPPQSQREPKSASSYTPSKLESSGKPLPHQEDQIWQHWLAEKSARLRLEGEESARKSFRQMLK